MSLGFSDYSLVYLIRKTRYIIPGCVKIISTWSFKNFNMEDFLADVELIQRNAMSLISDPNERWEFGRISFWPVSTNMPLWNPRALETRSPRELRMN